MYCQSLILILVGLMLASCATSPENTALELPTHQCQEPRPEVCTMEYKPVCGLNQAKEKFDFSNACSACSDHQIMRWFEGQCDTVE